MSKLAVEKLFGTYKQCAFSETIDFSDMAYGTKKVSFELINEFHDEPAWLDHARP